MKSFLSNYGLCFALPAVAAGAVLTLNGAPLNFDGIGSAIYSFLMFFSFGETKEQAMVAPVLVTAVLAAVFCVYDKNHTALWASIDPEKPKDEKSEDYEVRKLGLRATTPEQLSRMHLNDMLMLPLFLLLVLQPLLAFAHFLFVVNGGAGSLPRFMCATVIASVGVLSSVGAIASIAGYPAERRMRKILLSGPAKA